MVQDATDFFVVAGMTVEKNVRGKMPEQVRVDMQTQVIPDPIRNVPTQGIGVLGAPERLGNNSEEAQPFVSNG